jgi:excisionase family DNA binding protein
MTNTDTSLVLDTKGVAAALGISTQLAAQLIHEGEISSRRVGKKLIRVPRAALESYLSKAGA